MPSPAIRDALQVQRINRLKARVAEMKRKPCECPACAAGGLRGFFETLRRAQADATGVDDERRSFAH